MAIGPIAPPAAGFNAANRFVYDNLVNGAQVEVPWDGEDQAITLADPTDGDEWSNPASWWASGTPKRLSLPSGLYACSLEAVYGLGGGGVDTIRMVVGARAWEGYLPGVPLMRVSTVTYLASPAELSVEFWPDDETSSYYVKMRLEVAKIG